MTDEHMDRRTEDHWHLDKRIPIALIFTILSQTFIFGWFLSNHESRIMSLEKEAASVTHLLQSTEQKLGAVTKDSTETKIHIQYLSQDMKAIARVLQNDIEWLPSTEGGK